MFDFKRYKSIFILSAIAIIFLFVGATAEAANVGDIVNFNVDKSFDASGRSQVSATLIQVNSKLYFYVEKSWWDSQSQDKQTVILADLNNLSDEFSNNIYPKLTSLFGSEWSPGIDKDGRISILFESMNSTEGGYFREADEYEKLQLPTSNEREMLYLSVSDIDNPDVKVVLGHEFMHLIAFNQKNKIFGVEDDVWLNEARADYSSTVLGYDATYNGSNLQQRVKDFVENPSDSITDWNNTKYDYASVNLFTNYLVDHYGINILSDSLKLKSIGVQSITDALEKNGAKQNFSDVFTNWTITLTINDCSQNFEYCYKNPNLNSLRINPTLIFLPLAGDSSLSATNVTKNWAGSWQKIIGGSGNLKLSFSSLVGLNFKVPYVVSDKNNKYTVNFLQLDKNGKGEVNIQDFGTQYKSLIIIPSLQAKMSGFEGMDLLYPYTFTVSIVGKDQGADQILIQKLLAQIDSLKAQIAAIQLKNGSLPGSQLTCSQINSNLYIGMSNDNNVKCLQSFLKNQGANIYPEGLITGNFGNLTKMAVMKFQEKYEISQTGFVGPLTRAKINQILAGL